MSFKILCCLTLAGILTGLFPLSYQISSSSPWVTYIAAPNYIAYTGTHMYTQDRGMGIAIDLMAPEFSNIPAGWHRACAWAAFSAYGVYGNGQCSMPVQLVK